MHDWNQNSKLNDAKGNLDRTCSPKVDVVEGSRLNQQNASTKEGSETLYMSPRKALASSC